MQNALKEVSANRGEAIAGARLHPLDKGGQGIHIRALGTKVVPEMVLNAWGPYLIRAISGSLKTSLEDARHRA